MGIDVGYIDLVIQTVPAKHCHFLQRIGRSGHALIDSRDACSALTRDELARVHGRHARSVAVGWIMPIPVAPLDVPGSTDRRRGRHQEWGPTNCLRWCVASPVSRSTSAEFDRVVHDAERRDYGRERRNRVYLHTTRSAGVFVQDRERGMAAIANAGAILEVFSIRVVTEEDQTVVGSVDEDFGTESQAGEIFCWATRRVHPAFCEAGISSSPTPEVPPDDPFWRGEAPARWTFEPSEEVSALREDLEQRLGDPQDAGWLMTETKVGADAARQIVEYARAQKAAIGLLPTLRRVVFERFFDESGGMQMVIHAVWNSDHCACSPCANGSADRLTLSYRRTLTTTESCYPWDRNTAFPWKACSRC